MSPVLSTALDEAAVTNESVSGSALTLSSGLRAISVRHVRVYRPVLHPAASAVAFRRVSASEAKVSLTISASTLGVALSAALLAMFAERVNRKRMIVSCMTMLALCTLLTSTATSCRC